MIINTGGRTDTVQYYSDWLLRRFSEGYVLSRNPLFPNKATRYELTPDKVDCVVFCSKNYRPILPRLHEITDRFNTYFHYTITAYGADIEPGVPSIGESIDTLIELSKIVGIIAGGILLTEICIFCSCAGLGDSLDRMIIGAIIPLIPGVPFTNGIRDIADGTISLAPCDCWTTC